MLPQTAGSDDNPALGIPMQMLEEDHGWKVISLSLDFDIQMLQRTMTKGVEPP